MTNPVGFTRGTPVIINDADAPSASMIACIMGWNSHDGFWKARYLHPKTNMIYCWSARPTPVADFGMTVEIDVLGIEYRVVPHGECSATYDDGAPRRWQGYVSSPNGVWMPARRPAFKLLTSWLASEIKNVVSEMVLDKSA